jgi:IS4 transposase
MEYFSLNKFDEIELRGAWWLTRLPLTTEVLLGNGKALETRLNSRRQDILELEVSVEAKVERSPRDERRKKAKEAGKKPRRKGLIRDGWHHMLTNLKKEEMKISQLVAIYRARWAVEIQFREWKQALNLDKELNRRSNEHHMQALVIYFYKEFLSVRLGLSGSKR